MPLVFLESAFEDSHQRAGTKLIGDGGNILQALGFAKGAQKASALHAGAAQQAPFGEDDCPGDQAEGQQSEENELGDRTRAGKQIESFAADEKCRVGKKLHCDLEDTLHAIIDDRGASSFGDVSQE